MSNGKTNENIVKRENVKVQVKNPAFTKYKEEMKQRLNVWKKLDLSILKFSFLNF